MLEISNLSKRYSNGVEALQEFSLTIPPGIFGLLGPNGAGKSTLMRTLATLQQPDAGTITLDGLDLIQKPFEARKSIGYLPQDVGVYPRVSAREMLEYLAGLKGVRQAKPGGKKPPAGWKMSTSHRQRTSGWKPTRGE